jgi:hypothetical protein
VKHAVTQARASTATAAVHHRDDDPDDAIQEVRLTTSVPSMI